MNRLTYYNPILDPDTWPVPEDDYAIGGPLNEPSEVNPANLVSSLADDGSHYPALDIDIPCRYVQSSTKGHGHLYFDQLALSWDDYRMLLCVLGKVGILDPKYVEHSLRRAQTLLRPEGVKKAGI